MKAFFPSLFLFLTTVRAFVPGSSPQQHQSKDRLFGLRLVNDNNHRHVIKQHRRHHQTALCMGKPVGIFFGTSTGSTQTVADLIHSEFGSDVSSEPIEIDSIQGSVAAKFAEFDALVVGTPTWNTGADSERSGTGWDEVYYGEMQELDVAGKKVAVFGLGDSVSYSENYADASGELHDVFENLGCKMMGYTSQEGYEHEASKAIRGDLFCGLLCDQVNQEELTEERVTNWVAQLISEGILDGASSGVEVTTTAAAVPAAAIVVDAVPEPVVIVDESVDKIAQLEKENAELRKMLENSKLLEESIQAGSNSQATTDGFVPHHNANTGRTMWTSADGRSCYYTSGSP